MERCEEKSEIHVLLIGRQEAQYAGRIKITLGVLSSMVYANYVGRTRGHVSAYGGKPWRGRGCTRSRHMSQRD